MPRNFYMEWWAQILVNLLYSNTTPATTTTNNNIETKSPGLPCVFPQQYVMPEDSEGVSIKFGRKEIGLINLISSSSLSLEYYANSSTSSNMQKFNQQRKPSLELKEQMLGKKCTQWRDEIKIRCNES